MTVHEYQFRVEWGDTDAAGIVFSPNFYKWMDQAAHNYFESIGYPLSRLIKIEKIGIPVLESNCNFKKPLYFEEDVVIQTTILELHDKVVKFAHEFVKNGEVVAHGYQTRAIASIAEAKLKAISIPEDMRKAILESDVVQQQTSSKL